MLLAMPTAGDYLVGLPRKDMVQLWRVCAVFFWFFPGLPGRGWLPRRAQRRYGCNCGAFAPYFFVACWISFLIHIMLFLGKVQFGRIVLDRLNSHPVSP